MKAQPKRRVCHLAPSPRSVPQDDNVTTPDPHYANTTRKHLPSHGLSRGKRVGRVSTVLPATRHTSRGRWAPPIPRTRLSFPGRLLRGPCPCLPGADWLPSSSGAWSEELQDHRLPVPRRHRRPLASKERCVGEVAGSACSEAPFAAAGDTLSWMKTTTKTVVEQFSSVSLTSELSTLVPSFRFYGSLLV